MFYLNGMYLWIVIYQNLDYHILDLISAHLILYRRASLNTSLINAVGVRIKNAKKVHASQDFHFWILFEIVSDHSVSFESTVPDIARLILDDLAIGLSNLNAIHRYCMSGHEHCAHFFAFLILTPSAFIEFVMSDARR